MSQSRPRVVQSGSASSPGQHPLENAVAQNQSGRDRVDADEHDESPSVEFMAQAERVKEYRVAGDECGHLPGEERERPAAKQRVAQARERLDQKQGVKRVLVEFSKPLLRLRHARGKGRQMRKAVPPNQPRGCDNPDR